jgi:mannose-1-phosphate guanylyltransferase
MSSKQQRYIVIMAGGAGTRFWPASTNDRPKQFLDILGIGKSLLGLTYERALRLVDPNHIIVLTNKKYRELVRKDCSQIPDTNILCEPSRNNTAPAIAWAALHINARSSDSAFAVLPSDHVILKEDLYLEHLNKAFDFAEKSDAIVTLGINPTRPDTGYGYIKYLQNETGVKKVEKFVEKPDHAKAMEYLKDGSYLWNAGMFVWKTATIIAAFAHHSPGILRVLRQQPVAFGTDREDEYITKVFPLTENISIDYAILEKSDSVYTIPADIGWSDLGTWLSLYEYKSGGSSQNVNIGADALLEDAEQLMIYSNTSRKIMIRGLQNFIVVDDADALLIYPMDKEQELKKSLSKL